MTKKVVLSLNNVSFSYDGKKNVLNDISFDIFESEYICIVGSNGSGKSTLSSIISMLIKPSTGTISINNEVINSKNVQKLKKNIGVIFQNPDNQFIGITTEDDIAFGLENYQVNNAMMKPIIYNAAEVMKIEHLLKKEVFEMSGGQKQKVAITSVVALIPKIIIFDESTSMLDPKSKKAIKLLMKELQTKYNKTIISITHDMEELKQADKILCLNNSKLVKYDVLDSYIKNYNFLIENKLDLPKNLKFISELQKHGIKIPASLDIDKVVNFLCK